jgi:hypothetical protein
MKNTIVLTLLAILLTAGGASASGRKNSKEVRKFKKELTYPNRALDQQLVGPVRVSFLKGEDNQVEVVQINCPDTKLQQIVEDRIAELEANKIGLKEGKTYNVKLSFVIH